VAIGSMTRPPVLSVGVPAEADREFFGDTAMQTGFDDALAMLRRLGCRIVELPFGDFFGAAKLLYEGAFVAERYAAIADFFDRDAGALHEVTRGIIGGARHLTAADMVRSLYALQEYKARTAPLIASVDVICVPTAPTHYTVDAVLADPIVTNRRLGTYTNFVNLLDLCGTAIPTGTRRDGLPMSVTLLAPAGKDALAASLARDLHELSGLTLGATNWPRPAPLCSEPAKDDGIDLVVVGAHLSGMPLNRQLTALGARFVRATRTAPAYRLYALPGAGVPRPGMLREANGVAVDVEIWRLAPAAFGRFVAAIPAPLGIGTVALADGSAAKGFLVEPAALNGAADISAHGGWRAYMLEQVSTG
jgi:allophanate hydrolase